MTRCLHTRPGQHSESQCPGEVRRRYHSCECDTDYVMDTWGAVVVFWGCTFALVYAYLGYPLLLALLTRRRAAAAPEDGIAPKVSVIIAAYNEEECIAEKIRNTFAQEYPAHLLECIVVSDGSTDRTAEIA